MMTKGVQNKYIHFMQTLTSSNVYIFQKCIFKWKHFQSYFFIFFFFCTRIYSLFRSNNKIHDDKRRPKQIYSFHTHADIKQCLHISKVHFQLKTFMIKGQTKTTPSWSFILMLLMTTDQFSEFDRICIDQGLDLVLEGRAIFCGMPSNSSVVLTSGINIVSFRIRRSSWPCRNNRNPIILNHYREQFFIRHRKCVVHFGPFPFLALVVA